MENIATVTKFNIDFTDTFCTVNNLLMDIVYVGSSKKDQRDLALITLRTYIIEKLNNLGLEENFETYDLLGLVKYIDEHQENKDLAFHLIHYLLNTISGFQGHEVIWEVSSDFEDGERQMFIEMNVLDKIITANNIDLYETFGFVLDYLESMNLEDIKILTLE